MSIFREIKEDNVSWKGEQVVLKMMQLEIKKKESFNLRLLGEKGGGKG